MPTNDLPTQHAKIADRPGTVQEKANIATAKAAVATAVKNAMSGGKRPIGALGPNTPTPNV